MTTISQGSGWTIKGKVYDLNEWLAHHPGGEQILRLNKGRDCTELFETYHNLHPNGYQRATEILQKYYVRDALPTEIESPYDWDDPRYKSMLTDLQQRLHKYFADHNKSAKGSPQYILTYLVFAVISLYLWVHFSLGGSWLSCIPVGFFSWCVTTAALHNGTHYAMFDSRILNDIWTDIFGWYHCTPIMWIWQHFIFHHSYTNIEDKDIDMYWYYDHHHAFPVENNFIAQPQKVNVDPTVISGSPKQKRKDAKKKFQGRRRSAVASSLDYKKHEYSKSWYLGMPFLICMCSIGAIIRMFEIKFGDYKKKHQLSETFDKSIVARLMRIRFGFGEDNTDFRRMKYELITWSKHYFHLFLIFVVLPAIHMYYLGVIKGIIFYILLRFGHGIGFYAFSQVSHISKDAFRNFNFNKKQSGKYSSNFFVHQILSSVDYECDSLLWNILSIGLNNQTLHHLVPNLCPEHLAGVCREVMVPFCKKWNIERSVCTSYWDCLYKHFQHLYKLNS